MTTRRPSLLLYVLLAWPLGLLCTLAGTFTAVWSYGDMTGVDHFNLYVGTNAPVACSTTNAPVSGPWRTPVYVTAVDANGVESAPSNTNTVPLFPPNLLKLK